MSPLRLSVVPPPSTGEEVVVPNHTVYPVHLGTFHNADYSHFVSNTGFRQPPDGTDLRGDP
jgi:hypothetical protein